MFSIQEVKYTLCLWFKSLLLDGHYNVPFSKRVNNLCARNKTRVLQLASQLTNILIPWLRLLMSRSANEIVDFSSATEKCFYKCAFMCRRKDSCAFMLERSNPYTHSCFLEVMKVCLVKSTEVTKVFIYS